MVLENCPFVSCSLRKDEKKEQINNRSEIRMPILAYLKALLGRLFRVEMPVYFGLLVPENPGPIAPDE